MVDTLTYKFPFKKGLVLAASSAVLSVESLQLAVFSGITSTAENQFIQYHTFPSVVRTILSDTDNFGLKQDNSNSSFLFQNSGQGPKTLIGPALELFLHAPNLASFTLPLHRYSSQGYLLVNILHTKLCLKVCFSENSTWNTVVVQWRDDDNSSNRSDSGEGAKE